MVSLCGYCPVLSGDWQLYLLPGKGNDPYKVLVWDLSHKISEGLVTWINGRGLEKRTWRWMASVMDNSVVFSACGPPDLCWTWNVYMMSVTGQKLGRDCVQWEFKDQRDSGNWLLVRRRRGTGAGTGEGLGRQANCEYEQWQRHGCPRQWAFSVFK